MNLGLSDKSKKSFPSVSPMIRPNVEYPTIKDPHWLAGFTTAEGCFYTAVEKSATKIRWKVKLFFQLTQHSRDAQFMESLIKYLGCGKLYKTKTRPNEVNYRVLKFDDITQKIIPFFKNYPIQGVKALDFADWCQVAELMQNKAHFTKEGLEKIKQIKARMNRGRII